jgi:hypothetical protein
MEFGCGKQRQSRRNDPLSEKTSFDDANKTFAIFCADVPGDPPDRRLAEGRKDHKGLVGLSAFHRRDPDHENSPLRLVPRA